MIKFKDFYRKSLYKILGFLIAYPGQGLIKLLMMTCKWEIHGLEAFKEIAKREKCILALWHNRLALGPSILFRYTPNFIYAALVSKSRDGELLSSVVHSYNTGRTIRVSHQQRHQALRDIITHLEEKKEIVIITPDGPRGPCYEIKQGIAWTARETGAHVIPLSWDADRYWELKTWDKLKIPKPFSRIRVIFGESVTFAKDESIDSVSKKLKEKLMGLIEDAPQHSG
jgi:lysophospholipid acyltransferase (LPLAT)-like uncharacterized protein